MSRVKLATIGALALALAVGLFALLRQGDPPEPAREPSADPVPEVVAAPAPPAAAPEPAPPATAPQAPQVVPSLVKTAPANNYPTDPAALLRALRPMVREVEWGLESLDRRGGCKLGDAYVALTLETGEGEVWVREVAVKQLPPRADDAPPSDHDPEATAALDSTDEALVRCVNEAMKDRSIPAPSALPGRRWQTNFQRAPRPP